MNRNSRGADPVEADALLSFAAREMWSMLGRKIELDELRSMGSEGAARALAEWNGQGRFGPFALQRMRWAIIDGLRQRSRQERILPLRYEMFAAAALHAAAETATMDGRRNDSLVGQMLREAASSFDIELASAAAVEDAAETVERDVERMRVRRAVERLPEPGRSVIERRYYLGETFDEISAATGIHPSTVFDVHKRALRSLWESFRAPDVTDGVFGFDQPP